jgi:hypothetical protein
MWSNRIPEEERGGFHLYYISRLWTFHGQFSYQFEQLKAGRNFLDFMQSSYKAYKMAPNFETAYAALVTADDSESVRSLHSSPPVKERMGELLKELHACAFDSQVRLSVWFLHRACNCFHVDLCFHAD